MPFLFPLAGILFSGLLILLAIDYIYLFFFVKPPKIKRLISERLSNGEPNGVKIFLENRMRIPLWLRVIDELPEALQERNFHIFRKMQPRERLNLQYNITPQMRGEYEFGDVLIYMRSQISLLQRRISADAKTNVKVYPAFNKLGKYRIMAEATIQEQGTKRMRKIGHSMEFEQVKDYVRGDDMRSINWKATARRGQMMVNSYSDERSQQVYCVIDKGRLMKMPFAGLSLLDYSINAVLALTNICLQKQDKAGLITFSSRSGSIIAADRKPLQGENIMQALYAQQTGFPESDFEMLYLQIRRRIKQRSLIILFTNFESTAGLQRQLNYLRSIARFHLLLVIFFENTELTGLAGAEAKSLDDVYVKTIAEKLSFEKRLVVKELRKYGILSVLTSPADLTVNAINKYLELKARQAG